MKHNDLHRSRSRDMHSEPAAYLRTMLGIAVERGVDAAQLFDGSRFTLQQLEAPELRVTVQERLALMLRAIELTGDRGLGLEFGLRTTPAAHGPLGYAAMSCTTLREALELVIRYLHLRQRDVSLRLSVQAEQAVLSARDTHRLGCFRALVHEAMLTGLYRMTGILSGTAPSGFELFFDWPEPDYFASYRARLPPVHFGAAEPSLRFPAAELARPMVMADPVAVRRAIAECEREISTAGLVGDDLAERVRGLLIPEGGSYPALTQVASHLHVSTRTLKRQLAQRGLSFRELLAEARSHEAQRLLTDPELSIQHIASMLGYRDPPSFTRAFRRRQGQSPSRAR